MGERPTIGFLSLKVKEYSRQSLATMMHRMAPRCVVDSVTPVQRKGGKERSSRNNALEVTEARHGAHLRRGGVLHNTATSRTDDHM